jgi:tRNA (guanine26-N2/guanine27-N2)-dimethyltransferase
MTHSDLQPITEGSTTLLVYKHHEKHKGPAKKGHVPFYNPAMEMNRDISIAFLQWLVYERDKKIHALDGLAASGIRGIRIANEVTGDIQIDINDWSSTAFDLIQTNISYTKVSNTCVFHEDVHVLLSKHRYDYVDIDPFGTPAIFIDSTIRGLRHNGILAVTATDTATLCGVYPAVCLRRYGSRPFHSSIMHEVGLRIILGFIGREAAKYDAGIIPLLCYTTDHYMRLYVQLFRSVKEANQSTKNIRTISSSSVPFQSTAGSHDIGPLWIGLMQHKPTIQWIIQSLNSLSLGTVKPMRSLFLLLEEEAEAPPFFYTLNSIASELQTSPPSRALLFKALQDKGFGVWRTHIDPTGFKTDAPRTEIIDAFNIAKNQHI